MLHPRHGFRRRGGIDSADLIVVRDVRNEQNRLPRMHRMPVGYVILGLIGFLMLTLVVFEGAFIAGAREQLGHFGVQPPVAGVLAALIPTAAGSAISRRNAALPRLSAKR